MEATPIQGEKLTAWSVLPGGTEVSLDFDAIDGRAHRIVLPVDALSGLMMTLPRMLQRAGRTFPGRVVPGGASSWGKWRLEQPENVDGLILKLGTTTASRSPSC